ncbi:MAG: hypothetical protein ACD_51C00167G0002, partial [uncultured bacterium]
MRKNYAAGILGTRICTHPMPRCRRATAAVEYQPTYSYSTINCQINPAGGSLRIKTEETVMGNVIRYLCLVLLLFVTALAPFSVGTSANAGESEEGILVGRIAHAEGKLLRYIEEEKDWVVTVKDSPFGLEDALYSDEGARAEFIMPNKTWLRIGENTHIQL